MVTEAIILAGGFGTRLSHVLGDVPKPMAPVAGKPFLTYLIDRLAASGVTHVVLSTGHMHEKIESYFGNRYKGIEISYAHETTPLFTGGAINLALKQTTERHIAVLNGDTLFDIDIQKLHRFHIEHNATLSVALRRVSDTERYGAVITDNDGHLHSFREKGVASGEGLINGGIYIIDREWMDSLGMTEKFSFEKEILEKASCSTRFYGEEFNKYFIDIGIPDDYHRAQSEFCGLFGTPRFLFLDRDGVINKRIDGDYVKEPEEFEFLPGVVEAIARLSKRFERIFIVTNQQGIGKGRFTEQQLERVHTHMLRMLEKAGGRIDRIYHCPDLKDSGSLMRKPHNGMALKAKEDFPEVDFSDSVMVGDAISDIQFGYNSRMSTIFLTNGEDYDSAVRDMTDIILTDLAQATTHPRMGCRE